MPITYYQTSLGRRERGEGEFLEYRTIPDRPGTDVEEQQGRYDPILRPPPGAH